MSNITSIDLARRTRPQEETDTQLNSIKQKDLLRKQIKEDTKVFLVNGGKITVVPLDATADLAYYGKPKGKTVSIFAKDSEDEA